MTLFCVALAVLNLAPALGVLAAVFVPIAWLRTVSLVRRRIAHGLVVTQPQQVTLFLKSLGTIVVTLLLTIAMMAGGLSLTLLVTYTASNAGEIIAALAFLISGAGLTVLAIMLLVRFIDWRWKQDAGEA